MKYFQHLVGNVEPPSPLKKQTSRSQLKSIAMPGIEEEEEEIGVRPLELHRGQLASNSVGSQILVWNLQIIIRNTTKSICSFIDTSGQMSKRLATGGVGNWGSHLGGDNVSGELVDGHLYLIDLV